MDRSWKPGYRTRLEPEYRLIGKPQDVHNFRYMKHQCIGSVYQSEMAAASREGYQVMKLFGKGKGKFMNSLTATDDDGTSRARAAIATTMSIGIS